VNFPGVANNIFAGGGKSAKISFYPFETKKATFIAKNLMGKCQISKSRGTKPLIRRPCRGPHHDPNAIMAVPVPY